jgi:hypothetical protein
LISLQNIDGEFNMPCIKQYPRPVFYDPDIFKLDFDFVDDSSADENDIQNLTSSGSAESSDSECSSANEEYRRDEDSCASNKQKCCSNLFNVCINVTEKLLSVYVSGAYDDCGQTGRFTKYCRRAYDRGLVMPDKWWLGPYKNDNDGYNPVKSKPQKYNDSRYKKDEKKTHRDKPKTRKEERYTKSGRDLEIAKPSDDYLFAREIDYDSVEAAEIAKCYDGTNDSVYYKSHPEYNYTAPNVQRWCETYWRKYYASLRRRQRERESAAV